MFWEKWNVQAIGNLAHTEKCLVFGKPLNIYIQYLLHYSVRQHLKWEHFKYFKHFNFHNDLKWYLRKVVDDDPQSHAVDVKFVVKHLDEAF